MTLRCRVGDLAVVTQNAGRSDLLGAIVSVVSFYGALDADAGGFPCWNDFIYRPWIDHFGRHEAPGLCICPDSHLKPIRGNQRTDSETRERPVDCEVLT